MAASHGAEPFLPDHAPIRKWWRWLVGLRAADWAVLLLSPAYGAIAVIAPAYLHGLEGTYDDWIWPLLWNSVRTMRLLPTAVILFAGGFLAEKIRPGIGTASGVVVMSVFGIGAILGGAIQPGTHNLLPFELVVYAALSLIFIGGALGFRLLRRRRGLPPISARHFLTRELSGRRVAGLLAS